MRLITGTTRIVGVIGHPIVHSVSPQLHNTINLQLGVDLIYVPFDVEPANLESAVKGLKALNFAGFNVTVPYKKEVMKFLDENCREALLVGAVNTVKNMDGLLYGYNTDVEGFARAFREETGTGLKDKNVFIFGAGGGARAIAVKTASDGASKIRICSRKPSGAADLCSLVNENVRNICTAVDNTPTVVQEALSECNIVINASSSGMHISVNNEDAFIDDEFGFGGLVFEKEQIVYDIVYNPSRTALMKRASEFGCPTANGLGMLFYQGIFAYEIWTGIKLKKDFLSELYLSFRGVIPDNLISGGAVE